MVTALFGVATNTAAIDTVVELKTTGVFDLAADTAAVAAIGAKAYWDATAHNVTATATSNKLIGVFTAAKAATVFVARVRLNGVGV